ncbi:MAG: nucleotide cyclase [Olpidium bornovanus]|uniref:Nucleotide cyclase n=1 Tax=Olpidium bornovanus TaxID=278681 RepID=A0A8H8DMJ5_9FUNG|nr:MAG: nucleotide cyclase [Olpidium bornovanus]
MNTGKVLVGNFGSPDRLNYTCLGDNVNLASRLEGLNKYYGTEIIVSGTVFDNVQEHFVCRTLDSVAVKGKSVPTKVHELIAFRALASELLLQKVELYEQAYNLYCEANFLEAKLRFEKFLRLQPDDLPAEKHMSQCEIMLLEPPGAFWRPIVVLEGK